MPQIWLTYDEMGHHLRTSAAAARDRAIEAGLDRRKCSDGLTRVKLPADMAAAYLVDYLLDHGPAPLDALADQMVARLRQTADALAHPPARRAG